MKKIKFIFALHNHQPAGNFDSVFDFSYEKAYKPFLDLVQSYPDIAITLHYSGSLLEWLLKNKPEFQAIIQTLSDRGNVELLSGAYYEPMLTTLPLRDRLGQIRMQNAMLRSQFAYTPSGMWLPERVWSADMPYTIQQSKLSYTIIDEHRITNTPPVKGYYNSEHEGMTSGIFSISGELRKMIPDLAPEKVIDYLKNMVSENEQDVLVFMDNGEKYGNYPDSNKNFRWLCSFFELLQKNSACIVTSTFKNYWERFMPLGLRYPSEGAHLEMDEWAKSSKTSGAGWHAFLMKYPEANWMHKRMSQISRKIDFLESSDKKVRNIRKIKEQFWSGTFHDAYWHGVYGGIYLPHLRNLCWSNLLKAETAIDQQLYNLSGQIYQDLSDINRDGYHDVTIITKNLRAVFDSKIMGGLAELSYKPAAVNLCNTIACYPEDFHNAMDVKPFYDKYPRYSLIERYYDKEIDVDIVRNHACKEASDFLNEAVEVKNTPHTNCVRFSRSGWINWQRAHLCKTIAFRENGFTIHYKIKNNGIAPIDFYFGPEFNFAVNSGAWDQRFYAAPHFLKGKTLEYVSDIEEVEELIICNTAENYEIRITSPEAARVMSYPHILPVLSPGGVENIFQNLVLNYFWKLKIMPRTEKSIRLSVDILPCKC